MLKKTITYEDFNGEEVTEDFYFHLSKADLVELEMSKKGGLEAWIKRVVDSRDGKAIMEEFKNLIMMSVGERSEDGKRFRKSVDLRNDFKDSPAYDTLFMELVTNAEKAAEFVNGIIPRNMADQLKGVPQPARTLQEQIDAAKVQEGVDDPTTMRNEGSEPSSQLVGHPTGRPDRNVFEQNAGEPRVLTQAEVIEMDGDELRSGLATGKYRLS